MIRAVIFDFDGTLVDLFDEHLAAFQKAVARYSSIPFTRGDLDAGYGMKGEDILRLFFRKHSVVVNDETLMKIVLERRALAADGIAHNVKLLPGAQKLIEGLRNLKIKTAIATSCSRHACGVVFEKYPFAGNFDFIITGGEVSKGKPDPEIFLKAASSLEVSPEQCLVFEDSSYGVRAGKNAGMKVVAVLTGHESKMVLMAEKPDLILETLEDFDLKKLEKL